MVNKYTHGIFQLETAPIKVVDIICTTIEHFTTFNQLIKNFEDDYFEGILFICHNDTETIVYQHLILFARYYKLPIYGLEKGSRSIIEHSLKLKFVTLIFVKSTDPKYEELRRFLGI